MTLLVPVNLIWSISNIKKKEKKKEKLMHVCPKRGEKIYKKREGKWLSYCHVSQLSDNVQCLKRKI